MSKLREPVSQELDLIEAEHEMLKRHFQSHQEALVGLDLAEALAELEDFAGTLRRHIRLEDEILLPAYAALGESPRGGRAEFFTAEHRKIEALLDELLDEMRGLSAGTATRGRVVALLDRELRLKLLLDHHEAREAQFLLPRLRESLANGGKA